MKLSYVLAAVLLVACAAAPALCDVVVAAAATAGPSPLTISDLAGTWTGTCQQYGATNPDYSVYCSNPNLAPVTYKFNVTWTSEGKNNYTTDIPSYPPTPTGVFFPNVASPVGVVANITKFKYKSCVSILYPDNSVAAVILTITTDPTTGLRTYTESGILSTQFVPLPTCDYAVDDKLVCDSTRFSYKCVANPI